MGAANKSATKHIQTLFHECIISAKYTITYRWLVARVTGDEMSIICCLAVTTKRCPI